MKNFIRLNLILATLLLLGSGCKKKAEIDEDANALFFDIVYQVLATRETPTHSWINVSGKYQVQFVQQNSTQGVFTFFYQSYREPQFSNPVCSGGVKGNFEQTNTGTGSVGEGDDEGPYDPSNPYPNPNNTTPPTSTTPGEEEAEILFFSFDLRITERSLDPACRQEANRAIQIYRFQNGDLIMKNEFRELYLIPVKKK